MRFVPIAVWLFAVWPVAAASADVGVTKEQCAQAASHAQAARDAGKLLESRDAFHVCGQDGCPAIIRRDCGEWSASLAARIPSIRVRPLDADGQDVANGTLSMDDEPLKLDGRAVLVDPGPHKLTLVRGLERAEKTVVILESEKDRIIDIQLSRPRATSPVVPLPRPTTTNTADVSTSRTSRTPGWVFAGVGGASLIFGSYMGLLMIQRKDSAEAGCAGRYCTQESLDRFDEARTQGTISTIAFGVGVAALAVGIYLLVRPASNTTSALAVPRSAGANQAALQPAVRW